MAQVHRAAWEDEYGEIPKGLVLDHLCENKACYRLDHLDLVTQAVNMQRHFQRHPKQPQEFCRRGHAMTEDNYRTYPSSPRSRSCLQCERIRERIRRPSKVSVEV